MSSIINFTEIVTDQYHRSMEYANQLDVPGVHEFRVHVRALRTLLSFAKVEDTFKSVHKLLSPLRDLDVLSQEWEEIRNPNQLELTNLLIYVRNKLVEELQSHDFKKEMEISFLSLELPLELDDEFIEARLKQWINKLNKLKNDSYEETHQQRIMIKKIRTIQELLNLEEIDQKKLTKQKDKLGELVDHHIMMVQLESFHDVDNPKLQAEISYFKNRIKESENKLRHFKHDVSLYHQERTKLLGEEFARLQRQMIDASVPVLLIIEGWESSGHDVVIRDVIWELNPRNYNVRQYHFYDRFSDDYPVLRKYYELLPERGNMMILDRSYYFKLMNDLDSPIVKRSELIESFEKLLSDDGMVILKFFLHVKKKTHKKRLNELRNDKKRSFFITEVDEAQYEHYDKFERRINKILDRTDFSFAPWHLVSAENLGDAAKEIMSLSIQSIHDSLRKDNITQSDRIPFTGPYPLNALDLTKSVDDETYDRELKSLQQEIEELTYQLYLKKIPTMIVFEGVDAASKGGAIERLTRTMDPRFYDVVTISAPSQQEKDYHYLWRFYKHFPPKGKMVIFDRSWYGRVLVERIEGFASEPEWERAYGEINQMEEQLSKQGMLILKYFIMIDSDEQLKRFNDREQDQDKVYKLTDEDWRNRDHWDAYQDAMNEMLHRTSTELVPWVIVEGNDKRYARLKVLRNFVKQAKRTLNLDD